MTSSLDGPSCPLCSETEWAKLGELSRRLMAELPEICELLGHDNDTYVSRNSMENAFSKATNVCTDIASILPQWEKVRSDHIERTRDVASIDATVRSLQQREKELKMAVKLMSTDLSTAESRAAELDREIQGREAKIKDAENAEQGINQRLADARHRLCNLEEAERSQEAREQRIVNMETRLTNREQAISEKEKMLAASETALKDKQAKLDSSVKEYRDREVVQASGSTLLTEQQELLARAQAVHSSKEKDLDTLRTEHNRQCGELLKRRSEVLANEARVRGLIATTRTLLVTILGISSAPFDLPSTANIQELTNASSRIAILLKDELQGMYRARTVRDGDKNDKINMQELRISELEFELKKQQRANADNTKDIANSQSLIETLRDTIKSQRVLYDQQVDDASRLKKIADIKYDGSQVALDNWMKIGKAREATIETLIEKNRILETAIEEKSLAHTTTNEMLTQCTDTNSKLRNDCMDWMTQATSNKRQLQSLTQELSSSTNCEKRKYSRLEEEYEQIRRQKLKLEERVAQAQHCGVRMIEQANNARKAQEEADRLSAELQQSLQENERLRGRDHDVEVREQRLDEAHTKLSAANEKLKADWRKQGAIIKRAQSIVRLRTLSDTLPDADLKQPT